LHFQDNITMFGVDPLFPENVTPAPRRPSSVQVLTDLKNALLRLSGEMAYVANWIPNTWHLGMELRDLSDAMEEKAREANVVLYNQFFAARALALVREADERGYRDPRLDTFLIHGASSAREIATLMGALALLIDPEAQGVPDEHA
jgi:hypothetical protein